MEFAINSSDTVLLAENLEIPSVIAACQFLPTSLYVILFRATSRSEANPKSGYPTEVPSACSLRCHPTNASSSFSIPYNQHADLQLTSANISF